MKKQQLMLHSYLSKKKFILVRFVMYFSCVFLFLLSYNDTCGAFLCDMHTKLMVLFSGMLTCLNLYNLSSFVDVL